MQSAHVKVRILSLLAHRPCTSKCMHVRVRIHVHSYAYVLVIYYIQILENVPCVCIQTQLKQLVGTPSFKRYSFLRVTVLECKGDAHKELVTAR